MKQNNDWLIQPDKYYPPADDIVSIMRWHVALMDKAEGKSTSKSRVVDITEISYPPEVLIQRDIRFFMSLDYATIIKIETAMLIGCEIWYRGSSQYQQELQNIPLTDLDQWAEILEIPLTEEKGGNKSEAVDYMTSKRAEIWQCYIDAVEHSKQ